MEVGPVAAERGAPLPIVFAVTTALVTRPVLVPAAPGAPWFATEL